ncbi:MAG TPA: sulfotransferase, partial [Gemmatimonadales bacterium]|nr:sulfotransferase [Gemmatimonadales bacterium]
TILHDLLAQDPAHRVPLTWEVDRPFPPPETATYETDPRIAEVQAQLDMSELLIPGFKAMHPLGARIAQECVRITAADFRSMIFPTQYRVPSYARWLLHEADMAPAYRWHRRFLQALQSRHRAARWVLKSPGHVWCLGGLLAEYPNALLVQTHRDPLRIIASLTSLRATLRRLASDDPSTASDAAEFADYLIDGLDRSVTAREDGTVPTDRIVDVQFTAFMADPFATIRTIYERLGLEPTGEVERRMRDFLAVNPQDKHGRHHYTFADTGLDEGEWRERARRYQQYFDVPRS